MDAEKMELEEEEEAAPLSGSHEQSAKSQPRKKQVRRRLHASRPYQERLVNMAEARREIVTALQIHRASMIRKEKGEGQLQKRFTRATLLPPLPSLEESPHDHSTESETSCRVYPHSCTFHQYLKSPFLPLSLPFSDFTSPLPGRPLGLNLNLEAFGNVQASFCSRIHLEPQSESSSIYQAVVSSLSDNSHKASSTEFETTTLLLNTVVDDEEMERVRAIGEQHSKERNDTVGLASSDRWSSLLKNMEDSTGQRGYGGDHLAVDQIFDLPSWLNGDVKENLLEQQFDSCCYSEDYRQDASLPCLDIEEIEGWEWLS